MRIRTIKPEFWSHPLLGRLNDFTKLLAIGLLNMADDEGYFVADVSIIKSSLFPFTEDSLSIHGGLTDLSRHGWIAIKKHPERGSLGMVVNFRKHQVINRPSPSKIKSYWDSVSPHGVLTESSLLEQGTGNREQGESPALPASPEMPRAKDEWRYVQGEEWVRVGRKSGCSIGASNWESWKGAIERTGNNPKAFFAHAEKMPPDKRWFDKIEAALAKPKAEVSQGPKWLAWIEGGCSGPEPAADE